MVKLKVVLFCIGAKKVPLTQTTGLKQLRDDLTRLNPAEREGHWSFAAHQHKMVPMNPAEKIARIQELIATLSLL